MTDEEILNYIDLAIHKTIMEYKQCGIMKEPAEVNYTDATELISEYYKSEMADARITYALQCVRFDPYYMIIPLYFADGKTIEYIAEKLNVDTSTVVRNKKRLCLQIYGLVV